MTVVSCHCFVCSHQQQFLFIFVGFFCWFSFFVVVVVCLGLGFCFFFCCLNVYYRSLSRVFVVKNVSTLMGK